VTPRSTSVDTGLTRALAALAAGVMVLCIATTPARAATAAWSPVASPWDASSATHDIYAFGATGLAAAGDGHIAITRDGGQSWSVVVPGGLGEAVFTAIAFNASGHGIVASGGLLLVTDDWGKTWRAPSFVGPVPGAAINDVALRGTLALAVGDDGVIMSSGDSGSTWSRLASPTASAITSVAIAGDGTAVAGSATGEILVGTSGGWTLAGTLAGPVTSVAASSDPIWGNGQPDLFAATGSDVVGSDDALTFAPLAGLPVLTPRTWPALAWVGLPEPSLLMAGPADAGFVGLVSHQWLPTSTGLGGTLAAVAPDGQSVAYLLGANGRLVRTLSAGREPATVQLSHTSILVGSDTRLTATVRVGAPGVVLLQQRVPGRPWVTAHTAVWTSNKANGRVSFTFRPTLTHDYLLEFKYGESTTALAPAARVIVTPKITTTRSRITQRVGGVYRFSGSVTPALQGEAVGLFTDRGGSWRPVSQQGPVKLRGGRAWTSRSFGAPKTGTYHLRAHLSATPSHGAAWSRIVTVTVR